MMRKPLPFLLASLAVLALAALDSPAALAQPVLAPGTASVDYQGPSSQLWGGPLSEGDIYWSGPALAIPYANLGCVPSPLQTEELDALSYGRDFKPDGEGWVIPVLFSVDEFAVGVPNVPFPPNVSTEGAAGVQEASADVYVQLPGFPPGGNTIAVDGNGVAPPVPMAQFFLGANIVEPNPPAPGVPDAGDNLDALDAGTSLQDLQGPVFFSLDSAFIDPLEVAAGPPPNTGTAVAQGAFFNGGDVLVQPAPAVGALPPFVYADAYWNLGLDGASNPLGPQEQPDSDDLDALLLIDRTPGPPGTEEIYFDPVDDFLLFSVRRGSAIINTPDSNMGLPIEEGDILMPPPNFGMAPGIYIPAEWLGLATRRTNYVNYADDLDALDAVPEPATLVLLGLGALCLVGYASRRRRRAA